MPRKRKSQEYVTREALTDEGLSAHDRARFHAFNPRGVQAQRKVLDDQVGALVDAGWCKSGALVAYGVFDNFHRDRLHHLVSLKTGPEKAAIDACVRMYQDRNRRVAAFVDDVLTREQGMTAEQALVWRSTFEA